MASVVLFQSLQTYFTFELCLCCRPVDRKRARHAQIKKREDLSDIDEDDDSPPGRKGLSSSSSSLKKKRKRGKVNIRRERGARGEREV